ncbi:siroheme synthase [Phaffia rhodozyma]|uniref:precorrin-2 dehydrogenase n=1 Tax=Phaffia rhodozyma TaxID=264483 RepID=A0A0F7SP36_PHARH|nr:siroheme synthase [Phaffia rhodozyma]
MSRPQPIPHDSRPSTKTDIIASLFSSHASSSTSTTSGLSGDNLNETYVSHVKIFETDEGGVKSRYLILSTSTQSEKCFIHKAKRNSNGTFSKGKTWGLESLRTIEVVDPLHFSLTMSKTYRYATEREAEQAAFIEASIKIFRQYMNGRMPRLIGIDLKMLKEGEQEPASINVPFPSSANHPVRPTPSRSTSSSSSQLPHRTSTSSQPSVREDLARQPSGLGREIILSPSDDIESANTDSSRARQIRKKPGEGTTLRADSAQFELAVLSHQADQLSSSSHFASRPDHPASTHLPTSAETTNLSPVPVTQIPASVKSSSVPPVETFVAPPIISLSQPQVSPASVITSNGSSVLEPNYPPSLLRPPQTSLRPASPAALSVSTNMASIPNGSARAKPPQPFKLKTETSFSRALLLSNDPLTPLTGGGLIGEQEEENDEEEDVILANVEELLDGWEWESAGERADSGRIGRDGKGEMEKRLGAELQALEEASIHSLLEADDGVSKVMEAIDQVILHLDQTDGRILGYKIQLNAVAEDISYIETQSKATLQRLYAPQTSSPPRTYQSLPTSQSYRPSTESTERPYRPSQDSMPEVTAHTSTNTSKQDDWQPPAIPTMAVMGQPKEWGDPSRYDGFDLNPSSGGQTSLTARHTSHIRILKLLYPTDLSMSDSKTEIPPIVPGTSFMLAWRLNGRRVLLVGGGVVATGRLYYLLEAGAKVTLIAPREGLTDEVKHRVDVEGLVDCYLEREWAEEDEQEEFLTGFDMILTAIDDNPLSTRICSLSRKLRIPVNVADVPPQCDFYFGSQIRKGPLQIMVSTSGRGPRLAAAIRQRIELSLPDNIENAILKTGQLRAELRKIAPGVGGPLGARRMSWMIDVCDTWSLDELAEMDEPMMRAVLGGWESGEIRAWEDVAYGDSTWGKLRAKSWKTGKRLTSWLGGTLPVLGGITVGVVEIQSTYLGSTILMRVV